MNVVLLEPSEVAPDGSCVLDGRRADHIRGVLQPAVGDSIRVGLVAGPLGTARIVEVPAAGPVRLAVVLSGEVPAPMPVDLVLAVPRPKVLARVVEAAASFAVRRIELTNAWRVDKSYLRSPKLEAASLRDDTLLGAEQGGHTHLPPVALHDRFMQMMDAPRTGTLVVAHPGGAPLAHVTGPITLAIGPEGGWIQRELDTFAARGWTRIGIAPTILRTETAVAAALGQLALQLTSRS